VTVPEGSSLTPRRRAQLLLTVGVIMVAGSVALTSISGHYLHLIPGAAGIIFLCIGWRGVLNSRRG
jgi:hypothetical protein